MLVRTPLVTRLDEPEGTVPGRTSTPPTAHRRPCFSHVSIIAVGKRSFLSPGVPFLRHPCLFDNRVTFSWRQVSRAVTSERWPRVRTWPCLCLLTVLMVLSKEHRFGAKRDLMGDDRLDRDGAGLAERDEVVRAQRDVSCCNGTHTVHYQNEEELHMLLS